MPDKYIKLSQALEVLDNCACWWAHEQMECIPAADVRPVVRGKWEVGGMFGDIGRCSCCHYMFPLDTAMTEFHFCPNCGADMREES